MSELGKEWRCLQQQYEDYEKYSLFIKLINVAITLYLLLHFNLLAVVLVAVLYGQDAIFKTLQSRLGIRIMVIEQSLIQQQPTAAYQLHLQWQKSRSGLSGLLTEYAKQMMKPTVAFPHLVLLVLLLASYAWG